MLKTSPTTPCTSRTVGKSTTSSPLTTSTSSRKVLQQKLVHQSRQHQAKVLHQNCHDNFGINAQKYFNKNGHIEMDIDNSEVNIDILDIKHFASFRHFALNIDVGDYIAQRGSTTASSVTASQKSTLPHLRAHRLQQRPLH